MKLYSTTPAWSEAGDG